VDERKQIAVKLILVQIVLPSLLSLASFYIANDVNLSFLLIETFLCIVYFAGYWEFFSSTFKSTFFAALQLVLLTNVVLKLFNATNSELNMPLISLFALLEIYLVYVLAKVFITILKKEKNSREIYFPFGKGKYLITDGGNSKTSRLMNYHYYSHIHRQNKTNQSMLFATDIVKLDPGRKKFLAPRNEDYPLFGESVYAPMDGEIVRVENDIEDNLPYAGSYPYNTGNTVIIKNDRYFFLLGHLKKGSITISPGDSVKAGDLIGQGGNSGYTERPHLHMQLTESNFENFWVGKGISVQYEGRNLYKNRVIDIT